MFVAGECAAVGDVVEEAGHHGSVIRFHSERQVPPWKWLAEPVAVRAGKRVFAPLRMTDLSQSRIHGLVLAIAGRTSCSFCFCGGPPRWYSVRPSRRKVKASSGVSTNLKRFRSSGETVPALTK